MMNVMVEIPFLRKPILGIGIAPTGVGASASERRGYYMAIDANLDNLEPEEAFNRNLRKLLAADEPDAVEDEPEVEEIEEELEDDSDEDPETDISEEDPDEEELDEPQEEEIKPVKKKPSNKEQAKIVELKRELKEERERRVKAEAVSQATAHAEALENLVSKYTGEGYDEDTAKRYATQDIKMQQIERQLAISNFKAENAELFGMYPEAKQDVDKILRTMDTTGWTAKQVCRGLYEEVSNPVKDRAKKAVSGTLERKPANNSVSNATRTSGSTSAIALTQAQKTAKKNFERMFPNLGELSAKDYLKLKEQYGI